MARKGLSTENIISAATDLITEKGYEEFSLRELAAYLSVKPASLYNHTSNLAEIISAVGRTALSRLNDYMDTASAGLCGIPRLTAMAVAYRQFARENEELYKVIMHLPAYEDDTLKEDSHETVRKVYEAMADFPLTKQEKIMYTRALRSSIHGFVSLEMAGYFRGGTDIDQSYLFLVENTLRSLNGDETNGINQ